MNQQVKRNIGKFPDRYMFQLIQEEYDRLRSQNVTLKRGRHVKYLPYAFTDHGKLLFDFLAILQILRVEYFTVTG